MYHKCYFTVTDNYDYFLCIFAGLWSTKSIPNGTFLGPYVGDIVRDGDEKLINFRFAWEVMLN